MSAQDAIEYGIIDKIIQKDSNAIDKVMNVEEWDRTAGLVRANWEYFLFPKIWVL